MARVETVRYDLADLFHDQPLWFGRETVPLMLAWLGNPEPPIRFQVRDAGAESRLEVFWQLSSLRGVIPEIDDEIERLRSRRSVQIEQIPQYGAYALAGIVASAILRRRVVSLCAWLAPDLLFDESPGKLRGVEVAGRSSGGFRALQKLGAEKTVAMSARTGVVEAWISLWCATPRVSLCLKALG